MAGLVMKYFVLKPSGHDWHGEVLGRLWKPMKMCSVSMAR